MEKELQQIKKDKALMRLLAVNSISYLIATTSMGELHKSLRLQEDDYYYTLDSVQLDKDKTRELIKLLHG